MKKKIAGAAVGFIAIALIIFLINSLYTVRQNTYAVVSQFGKIVDVKDSPGIYIKNPFVQNVRMIDGMTQIYDIAPSDVMTSDKKSMIADLYILWRVEDPKKFVKTLSANKNNAKDRAGVSVYNAAKSAISSMTQDELIAARGEKLTATITEEADKDMEEYGIKILQAQIKSLDLPDDNKEAVYNRMISERNNIAAAYKAEGESKAQQIKNDTNKQVTVKQADARKQAAKLEAEGEAEYMKIMKDAYNDPEKAKFFNFTRSLDALKVSLKGNNKTIMLDKNSELAKLIYGSGLE